MTVTPNGERLDGRFVCDVCGVEHDDGNLCVACDAGSDRLDEEDRDQDCGAFQLGLFICWGCCGTVAADARIRREYSEDVASALEWLADALEQAGR